MPPVPFSWTGVYVGVHGGATNTTTTSNASCQDIPGPFTYTSSCLGDSFGPLFQQGSLDFSNVHAGGGVQAGGRVQFGILVVGIDIDVTRLSGSGHGDLRRVRFRVRQRTTVEQPMRWFGTTRATAGIAFGNVLDFRDRRRGRGDVRVWRRRRDYATDRQSVVQVG